MTKYLLIKHRLQQPVVAGIAVALCSSGDSNNNSDQGAVRAAGSGSGQDSDDNSDQRTLP